MGSACTKSDAEGIIDDERAVDLEKEDINEDEKSGVDLVDVKKTEKVIQILIGDAKKLRSDTQKWQRGEDKLEEIWLSLHQNTH